MLIDPGTAAHVSGILHMLPDVLQFLMTGIMIQNKIQNEKRHPPKQEPQRLQQDPDHIPYCSDIYLYKLSLNK